eukprot:scaffold80954_cov16-Tisochrysis_lutea.AAC.2
MERGHGEMGHRDKSPDPHKCSDCLRLAQTRSGLRLCLNCQVDEPPATNTLSQCATELLVLLLDWTGLARDTFCFSQAAPAGSFV